MAMGWFGMGRLILIPSRLFKIILIFVSIKKLNGMGGGIN